jgi:regulator of protease activity HflC (stomatin/prohibitin superfamily)
MSTIKHSLLTKFGQIYVNSNELGIVFRDGRFARFLSPGEHPILNSLGEQVVGHFALKWRSARLTDQMPARDGSLFTAVLDIQYYFNPNQANHYERAQALTIVLNCKVDNELNELVEQAALYSLRQEANQFRSEELQRSAVCTQIERRVRDHLHRALTPLGIATNKPDSVQLITLTLSPKPAADRQNRLPSPENRPISKRQPNPIKPGHNGDHRHMLETNSLINTAC